MENLEQIKRYITQYQNINLLPSPMFRNDSFPAALALFYSLEKIKKNVNLMIEDYPEKFNFLLKKEKPNFPQSDFLISIKEAGAKLSQLFYEKTDEGLNLFLKTTGGEIKQENITFHPLGFGDLLITVGVKNQGEIERFLNKRSFTIINIDNQKENESYGQLNLIETETRTLSEIIFEILYLIDEKIFDENISKTLLAGIIQGTSYLQSPNLDSKIVQKVLFLIQQGADLKEITNNFYETGQEKQLQIFKRVINGLEYFKERNLAVASLKKEDFIQTESAPKDLKFAFEKLSSGIFPFQNFLILWEENSSPSFARGVFYSSDDNQVKKIIMNYHGQQKGQGVLFKSEVQDLQKIKDNILNLL